MAAKLERGARDVYTHYVYKDALNAWSLGISLWNNRRPRLGQGRRAWSWVMCTVRAQRQGHGWLRAGFPIGSSVELEICGYTLADLPARLNLIQLPGCSGRM